MPDRHCGVKEPGHDEVCGDPVETTVTTGYDFSSGGRYSFQIGMCEAHAEALRQRLTGDEFSPYRVSPHLDA